VRREAHGRGLRYRVDVPLPGLRRRRADMIFSRRRVVVFINGCFWHSCPVHASFPAANRAWWSEKLAGNVARDRDTDEHMRGLGWTVLRFWEHEDPAVAVDVIERAVRGATS